MKKQGKQVFANHGIKAAGALLLLGSLSLLVGCQGVSAAKHSQQTGDLSFGSQTLDFGSVAAGSSKTLSVAATNVGSVPVTINSAAVSTKYFSLISPTFPVVIAAGQSVSFSVQFAPNATGAFSATVAVSSDASDALTSLSLSGSGVATGQLSPNPSSAAFSNVPVGSQQLQTVTLTNTGGNTIHLTQASVAGTGFQLSGINTPLSLNASQSTTFTVTFAPQTTGSATGAVTIASDASNPTLTIPLSGTGTSGVGQLTVSPGTLNLGNVVVGTSGTASGSLTASGASVSLSAASTNNSVFSVGSLTLPLTLSAGQSVPFTVTFSPKTTGAVSASLTFTSNAQPPTTTETLTGTGTPAPTHSVNLSWIASTSSNISGYNVYRAAYGTSCGGYTKINSVPDTTTLYTDSTVADGSAYCYAATAVNSSNQESDYSNIVTNVQIPPP